MFPKKLAISEAAGESPASSFPVCPRRLPHQIRTMFRRSLPLLLAAVLAGIPARAAAELHAAELQNRFGTVEIQPSKASILLGTVTLAAPRFVRKDGIFRSTYSATVFPYFFFDETGTIAIDMPDEALRRLARGEKIAFAGRGTSDDGENRRIDGLVDPIDAVSGRIRVRIFISRRISLEFNTSYRLKPANAGGAAALQR